MWEDPALVGLNAQQVRAWMAAENGAARDNEPSTSTASSSTAGDEVALGAEEKAENAKNSARYFCILLLDFTIKIVTVCVLLLLKREK
uniref:Uncharacterized protein n=1 Tax=Romanomermis culicivorax TaxID=13658 RepID=A0A915HG95_ROMCU